MDVEPAVEAAASSSAAEPKPEPGGETAAAEFASFATLAAQLCAPGVVRTIAGKGKGCVASRAVEQGELLWAEPALLFLRAVHTPARNRGGSGGVPGGEGEDGGEQGDGGRRGGE